MSLSHRAADLLRSWPVVRQRTGETGTDPLGRGAAVQSSRPWRARTEDADRVVDSG